jgi:hypothetical protein
MDFATMPRRELRAAQAFIRDENKRWPAHLVKVPPDQWSHMGPSEYAKKVRFVWRSNRLLVQVCEEPGVIARVSVNRTLLGDDGRFVDGLTWEDLQAVKDAVGFAGFDAVEVYPRAADIVNVANMRHLWVLFDDSLPFAWRNMKQPDAQKEQG